jgi:hypothetical protein
VSGRVLSPSGNFGLFDAVVSLDLQADGGASFHRQTHTRPNGDYVLRGVPVGRNVLTGSQGAYAGTVTVEVPTAGAEVTGADIRVDPSGAGFVVVEGIYDAIEDILGPWGLGFSPALVPGDSAWLATVATATSLQDHHVLFLDCGLDDDSAWVLPDLPARRQTLLDWVAAGNSLYASDWAYDVVEWLLPEAMDFLGDDGIRNEAQQGDEGTVVADIKDPALEKIVGRSVAITYDLGAWAVITSAATLAEVQVIATGTVYANGEEQVDVPLAVKIQHGLGRVIFTTFHNHAQLDPTTLAILQYMVMSL